MQPGGSIGPGAAPQLPGGIGASPSGGFQRHTITQSGRLCGWNGPDAGGDPSGNVRGARIPTKGIDRTHHSSYTPEA